MAKIDLTSDYDYHLPEGQIAQTPAVPRDHSRLMLMNRQTGEIQHERFYNLPNYLRRDDILVLNNTRVIPARFHARKTTNDLRAEVFLLRQVDQYSWECLTKPARRLKTGTELVLENNVQVSLRVEGEGEAGRRQIRFSVPAPELLPWGEIPLPTYINKNQDTEEKRRQDYQTVYAERDGAVAAPTAGLHFTEELLGKIRNLGVTVLSVTLHVGIGTFRPISVEDLSEHRMHSEYYDISRETFTKIQQAKQNGRRIIAVGTTSTRVLESLDWEINPENKDKVNAQLSGSTDIFIKPGYQFRCIDGLLTNFHLPRSSLLVMVSAFAGRERILDAYQRAIEEGYRFYSYGDGMVIV